MDLSIIIVSYNVRSFLEQCLLSVYASIGDIAFEVFVVDNNSQDGAPDYIRQRFSAADYPNLHILANSRNVGFGRANNQAVAKARGEYVLFLNPDTVLTETTLKDSLDFARRHHQLGALGTMMLHTDGRFAYESRRGLPTPWTAFCKMTGLASLLPKSRLFGRYYLRYLDENKPSEIDVVSGAYMMIPRKVLLKYGAFDERFFMYGEDIDLSYRLLKAGLKNYYIPSPILHYKGESTQKSTYRYVHVFYGAMLIFFKKHYRHYAFTISLPIKAAIFSKAILALTWQQLCRIKNFILPQRKELFGKQIYVGRHFKDVMKIAQAYDLDIVELACDETNVRREQIMEALTDEGVHIIFDTDNFSRSYILDFFRKSNHKHYIGTYSPYTGNLITGSYTLSLNTRNDGNS